MDLIESLKWRYAVKKFNKQKKISNVQINKIIKATILSPSSYGIQTYNIIIIEDKNFRREKLQPFSSNPQISDASHLILFTIKKSLNIDNIKNFLYTKNSVKNKSILDFIKNLNDYEKQNWQKEQVYLALGFLLYYCAMNKIDSCPIGGFSKNQFDNILNFKNKNLMSVVLVAVGYRCISDKYQYKKKIRKPISEILIKY